MFDTDNLSEMSLRPFEIKNNLNELEFINQVNIHTNSEIKPLYDFNDFLLDLEG